MSMKNLDSRASLDHRGLIGRNNVGGGGGGALDVAIVLPQ